MPIANRADARTPPRDTVSEDIRTWDTLPGMLTERNPGRRAERPEPAGPIVRKAFCRSEIGEEVVSRNDVIFESYAYSSTDQRLAYDHIT